MSHLPISDRARRQAKAHGWPDGDIDIAHYLAVEYHEFPEGVVILSESSGMYVMTAFSEGNKHSLAMWRVIRRFLTDYRDKPLVTSYTANREKLLKASERYNYVLGEGDVVIFPRRTHE